MADARDVAASVAKGHTYRSLGQSRRRRPRNLGPQVHPHAEGVPYRRGALRQPYRLRRVLGGRNLGRRFVSR